MEFMIFEAGEEAVQARLLSHLKQPSRKVTFPWDSVEAETPCNTGSALAECRSTITFGGDVVPERNAHSELSRANEWQNGQRVSTLNVNAAEFRPGVLYSPAAGVPTQVTELNSHSPKSDNVADFGHTQPSNHFSGVSSTSELKHVEVRKVDDRPCVEPSLHSVEESPGTVTEESDMVGISFGFADDEMETDALHQAAPNTVTVDTLPPSQTGCDLTQNIEEPVSVERLERISSAATPADADAPHCSSATCAPASDIVSPPSPAADLVPYEKPVPISEPVVVSHSSALLAETPSAVAPHELIDKNGVHSPSIPPLKKSWATLFSAPSQTRPVVTDDRIDTKKDPVKNPDKPVNETGAILSNLTLNLVPVHIQVRPFINRANWCYINATLQALIACPPFFNLMKSLPRDPALSKKRTLTPVLDAMVWLVNQFQEVAAPRFEKDKKKPPPLACGEPLEPVTVYQVLNDMKSAADSFQLGKQEDAEEFLTCLLNTLHEEMGAAIKQNCGEPTNGFHASGPDSSQEDEDWEEVGPRNKCVVTRSSVDQMTTPISQLFGGKLRSTLYTNKESATLEPFFTVQLNVQTPTSIDEALRAFVSKEYIEGYTCSQTKKQMDAHRRLLFEELPLCLILHLKCFVYDKNGGSQKFLHNIVVPEILNFDNKELLSPQGKSKHSNLLERKYKLFAVVYHSGPKTTGGHYHTDVLHTGVHGWVRFDDNNVRQIPAMERFKFEHPCVPYLLYYKRKDMLTQQHQ